jgi:NADP-dependent 3-hydroxy acid dehydrogenase YdfG
MSDLDQKVIVLTGGASGLGRACATSSPVRAHRRHR